MIRTDGLITEDGIDGVRYLAWIGWLGFSRIWGNDGVEVGVGVEMDYFHSLNPTRWKGWKEEGDKILVEVAGVTGTGGIRHLYQPPLLPRPLLWRGILRSWSEYCPS